jgi:hypothetical protein
MESTTTRAQLSRDLGVSKPAITKAVDRGDVILTASGKVDLNHRVTLEYIRRHDKNYQPPEPKQKTERKPKSKSEQKKKTKKKKPKADDQTVEPEDDQLLLPMGGITAIDRSTIHLYEKRDLEKLKIFEQATLENIKVQEKEGKLISRELVSRVFAKIYTVDTEQLRALEDNLTPKICGVFGISEDSTESVKVKKEINVAVSKALSHIKRLIDSHLVSVGDKKL